MRCQKNDDATTCRGGGFFYAKNCAKIGSRGGCNGMAAKADRKKLKKEYLSGGVSFASLARKYKISESTVKRWAKADGWSAAKAEADAKANQKMIDAAAEDKCSVVAGVIEIAGELLKRMAAALEAEPADMDPARMRQYTAALKDIQDIRGDKNALDLKEQKTRIKRLQEETKRIKQDTARVKAGTEKMIAEAEANRPENREIRISLEGDLEEYGG